jgi:hypothetical protein
MLLTRRHLMMGAAVVPLRAAADEVPALDAAKIRPSDFTDADVDLPFYLAHFARVANSVVMDGPDRGFIKLSVWRTPKDNLPHNARIMENILSLAWFYTARRKWNPYRGHPAVRARLEAAFDFWCRIQDPDGRFSEYKPQGWNLAATAFAVKFIAEALRLLKTGPPIDHAIHQRAIEACRKAMRIVLVDEDLYRHGRAYSNQYTNIFAGGAAFLAIYPDRDLDQRLRAKVEASNQEFQSPLGYFYEADGPDLGYNLSTHHENVHMAYHYWRNTPLGATLVTQEKRFAEWLSYNALPEPGKDLWVQNRSIETRQRHSTMAAMDTPAADRAEMARAFATSPEKRAAALRTAREKLSAEWPRVDPLQVGQFWAYTPYRFLQRSHYDWHPTAAQIAEARKLLKPLQDAPFIRQMKDTRRPLELTYVRRPGYYAAFAAGTPITGQQRYGLTLVWSPKSGVLLQSQTSGAETAWGTAAPGGKPFEAAGVAAAYKDGGAVATYPLAGGGQKSVTFAEDRILVRVERAGEIVERLPVFNPACVHSDVKAAVNPQAESPVAGKPFAVVELRGSGTLSYEIRPA